MSVIDNIESEIKVIFEDDASGHDYWHSLRVYHTAMKIAKTVPCDENIVAIAALLHDVDDEKLFLSDDYENARDIMRRNGIDEGTIRRIIDVIKAVPYRGAESVVPDSTEGKVVQDADRLDAMGAIGIARTFAFGGSRGLPLFDPDISPAANQNEEAYKAGESSSVKHFYEKLFLLKDKMNTEAAKEAAASRDAFMHAYLNEFLREWDGI